MVGERKKAELRELARALPKGRVMGQEEFDLMMELERTFLGLREAERHAEAQ